MEKLISSRRPMSPNGGLICLLALALLSSSAQAGKFNKKLSVGEPAPNWSSLPGVDGKSHSLADYEAKLLVVVFTCNGCPVASAYQERLNQLVADFKDQGVDVVAINVNPGKGESLEKMAVRAQENKFAFDYLKDVSQASAKAYGARTTPTVFVLDQNRKVAYMGAIDDNWETDKAVVRPFLREAIHSLLAGQQPEIAETRATGCGIPFGKDDSE